LQGSLRQRFALAVAPADYRIPGVKTFIFSYEGVVYRKGLGPDAPNTIKAMDLYVRHKTWQRIDDNW
jgi:hypothetical protein